MYGPPDHHFWGSKSLFFWSCFGPPNNGSWKNPPKWKTLGAQTTYNALSKYLVVSRGPRTWLRAISRGPDKGSFWGCPFGVQGGVIPGTYLEYGVFALFVSVCFGAIPILE